MRIFRFFLSTPAIIMLGIATIVVFPIMYPLDVEFALKEEWQKLWSFVKNGHKRNNS